jgi:hypothetical protein
VSGDASEAGRRRLLNGLEIRPWVGCISGGGVSGEASKTGRRRLLNGLEIRPWVGCIFGEASKTGRRRLLNGLEIRPWVGCISTFGCFGQPFCWQGDRGYTGDWQLAFALVKMSRERYAHVSHAQRLADIREKRNVIKEMTAILTAMKPPRPRDRNLVTTPRLELLLVED